MDPALLRERELFKKRALSTPAIEKRPTTSDSGSHKKKKPKVDKETSSGSKLSAGKTSRKQPLICVIFIHYSVVLLETASLGISIFCFWKKSSLLKALNTPEFQNLSTHT